MLVVIDASILISASLNPIGKISKIIFTASPKIEFIVPEFAMHEIKLHARRICHHAGIEIAGFSSNLSDLIEKVFVFSSDSVDASYFNEAKIITANIDVKDSVYVGFELGLDAILWTGDTKLIRGLGEINFKTLLIQQNLPK